MESQLSLANWTTTTTNLSSFLLAWPSGWYLQTILLLPLNLDQSLEDLDWRWAEVGFRSFHYYWMVADLPKLWYLDQIQVLFFLSSHAWYSPERNWSILSASFVVDFDPISLSQCDRNQRNGWRFDQKMEERITAREGHFSSDCWDYVGFIFPWLDGWMVD